MHTLHNSFFFNNLHSLLNEIIISFFSNIDEFLDEGHHLSFSGSFFNICIAFESEDKYCQVSTLLSILYYCYLCLTQIADQGFAPLPNVRDPVVLAICKCYLGNIIKSLYYTVAERYVFIPIFFQSLYVSIEILFIITLLIVYHLY